MGKHLLPPPPLPAGASPWEGRVVADMEPMVAGLVRRVHGLQSADWDEGDGVQRVLVEVTLACRRWAKVHGPTRPDERYVWAAIHRARKKLYRGVKRAAPRATIRPGDGDEWEPVCVTPCNNPGPLEVAEGTARQRLYVEVTAGLFAGMSEDDAALMRLSADGMSPQEIADHVGRPGDNVVISQRLYVLRRRAREQLAKLGIWALEDVHELHESPFDAHHAD